MKILVTGASGYVGNRLAHTLANRNIKVHAFVRSSTAESILQHPNIIIFKGDLPDKESLSAAIKGCEKVYHSCNENNLNKNFGETFLFWDKLFGTFKETNER